MPNETETTSRGRGSIFVPGKLAFLIGGIVAYTCTPALVGLYAVGSAVSVGVAAGYGARWGGKLGKFLGFFGGGLVGSIFGAAAGGVAGSTGRATTEGAVTGGVLGGLAGGLGFTIVGWAVGSIVGGVMLYNVAKPDVVKFFHDEAQTKTQQAQMVQPQKLAGPVRATSTYNGQTFTFG